MTHTAIQKKRIIDISIGIVIGILIGVLGSYMLGNRYDIKSSGPYGVVIVKVDKWTGKTWKLNTLGGEWERVW